MAKNYSNLTYSQDNIMPMPLSMKRTTPGALDHTSTWTNWDEMVAYVHGDTSNDYLGNPRMGAAAYVGQVLTFCGKKTEDSPSVVEAYIIGDEAGTLIKLASTTASGDLASDIVQLQSQVNTLIATVGIAAEGSNAATGLFKAIDDVEAIAESKVASVAKGDNSITIGGSAAEPTVAVAISSDSDNSLSLVSDGLKVVAPEYTLEKLATTTEGAFATYQLKKGSSYVGAKIDIPKDMVVSGGSVETFRAGALPSGVTTPGTYIVLTLANAESTTLYIPVDSLIEYVTGGSTEDVIINVTADTHVATATLTEAVKAKLNKADSALQAADIITGSNNGTFRVKTGVGADASPIYKDVSIHGLGSAAYKAETEFDTAGAADNVKSELLGDTVNPGAETIRGVKKVADEAKEAIEALDVSNNVDSALATLAVTDASSAGQFVTAVNQTKGKISVSRAALQESDIPALSTGKISGLDSILNGKADKGTTLADYGITNAYTTTDVENRLGELGTKQVEGSPVAKTVKEYVDEAKAAATYNDAPLSNRVTTNEEAIAAINHPATGIYAQAKNYADGLASNYDAAGAAQGVKDELLGASANPGAETIRGVKKSVEELTTTVGNKVASVTAADNSITVGGTATAPTVGVKVDSASDNALSLSAAGLKVVVPAAPEYSVAKQVNSGDYAAIYHITKDGVQVGDAINIPKDLVVQSGTVETYAAGSLPAGVATAGTYIKLVIQNQEQPLYINAASLIEYVTSGSGVNDKIQVTVDPNTHKVTADIKAGAIMNVDVNDNAAIAQSKINGLVDALAARLQGIKLGTDTANIAVSDGIGTVPVASASAFGVVKSSTAENQVTVNADGTMTVNQINVSMLVQDDGEDFIISGGGAAG